MAQGRDLQFAVYGEAATTASNTFISLWHTYKKVTNTIENLPKIKLSLENVRINDFFNVLLSLYKSV